MKRIIVPLFLSSLSMLTYAKISIPVEDAKNLSELPRSQIKNYIQRGTLEENLRPIRQIKPQALDNEELLSIPEKYLPPDLRIKQQELRKQKATQKIAAPSKKMNSSDFVTIRGRGESTQKLKLDETVWAASDGGAGASKAVLLPQRKLPSVELLEEVKTQAGQEVHVEVEPGERREMELLFDHGKTQDKDKISLLPAYRAYAQRDYATAVTLSFKELANKKNSEDTHEAARFLMAHALYQAEFYASALPQLVQIASGKWRRSAIGMVAKAIEKTRDDASANQILSKVSLSQIPDKYRSLYAYHLGRVLLNTGAGEAAMNAFLKVEEGNPRRAEAQYYCGVIVSSSLDPNTSTEDWNRETSRAYQARSFFEEAIRLARNESSKDLLELAQLSLARLAYQLKEYNQAVYHYGEVPATSPFAKEAIFETAWSLYRLGEYNRSLGKLHPLGSPYYENRDLAELWILRSLNYLKLCRFDEANLAANTFKKYSQSQMPEVQKARADISKTKFENIHDIENLEVPEWIKVTFLNDPVIMKDKTRIALLEKESEKLGVLAENYLVTDAEAREDSRDTLRAVLKQKMTAVSQALKPYFVSRLGDVLDDYQRQLSKLDFLKFEVYSQASKFPDALSRNQAKKLMDQKEFLPGVFLKGHEILWKFNTEYWLDELYGYDYFIPTECSQEKRL